MGDTLFVSNPSLYARNSFIYFAVTLNDPKICVTFSIRIHHYPLLIQQRQIEPLILSVLLSAISRVIFWKDAKVHKTIRKMEFLKQLWLARLARWSRYHALTLEPYTPIITTTERKIAPWSSLDQTRWTAQRYRCSGNSVSHTRMYTCKFRQSTRFIFNSGLISQIYTWYNLPPLLNIHIHGGSIHVLLSDTGK